LYLVTTVEKIYDEDFIIREMLATGEYGINAHPISHEAIIEFIRDREWGLGDVETEFLKNQEVPTQISIQDEDGEALYFASTLRELV
jgi:hypothetical protein